MSTAALPGGSADGLADGVADGLAETLRRYRIERNLTQVELATATGLSVRSVRNVELGRVRSPRTESLRRIARALALSDDELQQIFDLANGHRLRPARSGGAINLDAPSTTSVGSAQCGVYLLVVMPGMSVSTFQLSPADGAPSIEFHGVARSEPR